MGVPEALSSTFQTILENIFRNATWTTFRSVFPTYK